MSKAAGAHRGGSLVEAELCEICGQEKTPLPTHTDKKGIPVFVCTVPKGKQKMPCDGFAPALRDA